MPPTSDPTPRRRHRLARSGAALGLTAVAAIGAINSWGSLYEAAVTHLTGVNLPTIHGVSVAGATFPLLLDALIIAASLQYVIGVKEQRPVAGWRAAAHAAIAGSVAANAAAAHSVLDAPWHMIAPACLSLVVELVARDVLGELREVKTSGDDRIPWRLWISAPGESARTQWRMLRTGQTSAAVARVDADRCAAARDALRRVLPGQRHYRTRREITRRLWAGSISPGDVFAAIGWTGDDAPRDADTVLRLALGAVLGPDRRTATATADTKEWVDATNVAAAGNQSPSKAPKGTPKIDRSKVRDLHAQGSSNTEIARALGCSPKTVSRILSGETQPTDDGHLRVVGG
jgi:hypothetical protein